MTIEELHERLEEKIILEREELAESARIAPNSYGAGYNRGYIDALQHIINAIIDKEDTVI